jgi:hypothetical protein
MSSKARRRQFFRLVRRYPTRRRACSFLPQELVRIGKASQVNLPQPSHITDIREQGCKLAELGDPQPSEWEMDDPRERNNLAAHADRLTASAGPPGKAAISF